MPALVPLVVLGVALLAPVPMVALAVPAALLADQEKGAWVPLWVLTPLAAAF